MSTLTGAFADGKILAEAAEGIGTLTFNQPEKHNAIAMEMWAGLGEVLEAWEDDPHIRVAVLTGAGDKAFVSGGDISQFERHRAGVAGEAAFSEATERGRVALATFSKPMIARIRGYCLGGGLAIAMTADLRIAAEGSSFGIPAARLGIAYSFDRIQQLMALVGPANARMILYSGKRFPAADALRMGLINEVVPVDALDATVRELALTIAANAPLSVSFSKFAVSQALLDPGDRDMAHVERMKDGCFASEDYVEGRRAFMEKRRPQFQGR